MRKLLLFPFVLIAWIAAASPALAAELNFDVTEDDDGVTIKVRGLKGESQPKRVVTSRTGMLFFFDGHRAKTKRLRPEQRHRLAYAQVGRTGTRVAVRLAQRDRARGSLSPHVTYTAVTGGLDVRIIDRQGKAGPTKASDDDDEIEIEAADDSETGDNAEVRTATLAALEASLGDAEDDTPDADEPTDADEAEDADDAPIAAAVPETQEPPMPEIGGAAEADSDSGSDTSAAGLRSLLAVALLLAFGGGAMWWIKRRKQTATGPALDIISRVGIGPRQSIVLLRAGGRQLLIGATERRIAVLSELGASVAIEAPPMVPTARPRVEPPVDPSAPNKIAAFKARLEQALGKELTGEHPIYQDEPQTPPHLRLLSSDPRWVAGEDVA